jgi:hypothetical protein
MLGISCGGNFMVGFASSDDMEKCYEMVEDLSV